MWRTPRERSRELGCGIALALRSGMRCIVRLLAPTLVLMACSAGSISSVADGGPHPSPLPPAGDGGGQDGQAPDVRDIPCGCADRPASLTLHVLDAATTSEIVEPTFSEG